MATKHLNHLIGKTGRIYIARNGTVMIFVLSNGNTFFSSCTNPTNVITGNPDKDWWVNSIDWAGNKSDYFAFGFNYDAEKKPFYPDAKPLVDFKI